MLTFKMRTSKHNKRRIRLQSSISSWTKTMLVCICQRFYRKINLLTPGLGNNQIKPSGLNQYSSCARIPFSNTSRVIVPQQSEGQDPRSALILQGITVNEEQLQEGIKPVNVVWSCQGEKLSVKPAMQLYLQLASLQFHSQHERAWFKKQDGSGVYYDLCVLKD